VTRPDELVVAAPAARALAEELPEAVAHAVIDIGRELRRVIQGVFAARRGTYRVLYRINEAEHEVTVIRIDHRRDVYRR
jgi:mRNA-degrading endonuclease RelE of RelBE toxin-antitoxin system